MVEESKENPKTLFGLYYCELVVLLFTLAALGLFGWFGLALRSPLALYITKIQFGFLWYGVGLLVSVLILRLIHLEKGRGAQKRVSWSVTGQSYRALYLSPRHLWRDLRLIHALSLLFVTFINLKHLIPFINAKVFDAQLIKGEAALFGPKLAGGLLHDVFGIELADLFSVGYTSWYAYVAVLIYIMVLQRDAVLAQKFAFSFALLWFVGILIVYLYPTWGPCFSFPEHYEALRDTGVGHLQQGLWKSKLYVDWHPQASRGIFAISGLPSIHFALTLLGSLYLGRVNRVLALFSWVYAAITGFTTIYFGWHYVSDDIAAVFLVLLVQWAANRIFGPLPSVEGVSDR